MTPELAKRREETLNRRKEKVKKLYKAKAEEILKKAEEFFVSHPRNGEYKAVIKMSSKEAEIFCRYLKIVAMDDKWGFWVDGFRNDFLKTTIFICDKYPYNNNEAKETAQKKYLWVLSEKVKD